MSLVVYANPSGGTDPGHMVIGQEPPHVPTLHFGYRFDPLDLPAAYQPPPLWRSYLFGNTTPGYICDESAYVAHLRKGPAGVYYKRVACPTPLTAEVSPPAGGWQRHALYSFDPDTFDTTTARCYNCVSWAVEIANRLVTGFLTAVRQGRVKLIVPQLTPYP